MFWPKIMISLWTTYGWQFSACAMRVHGIGYGCRNPITVTSAIYFNINATDISIAVAVSVHIILSAPIVQRTAATIAKS